MKEEDVPAEAVEADAPEAVANGAADKNGGGSKGKYDRPGNVKRPKAKKNEVNLSSNFMKRVCSKSSGKTIVAPIFCFLNPTKSQVCPIKFKLCTVQQMKK